MAATNLLTLIDDIATILDDISVMTQVAAKKTAGVLGDDLALNAQQVSGVNADRELPVVWAVAKGSLVNKAILVPLALLISSFLPWAITPLLMLGGLFLCFEGSEKVLDKFFHQQDELQKKQALKNALADDNINMLDFEKNKIKGAIRTDFILSAEIIVISLGTVATVSFTEQLSVLVAISLLMTVGVYGLVAGIVRLDDMGLYLQQSTLAFKKALGSALLSFAPRLMKFLTFIGTLAMFLVGGGILSHGAHILTHPLTLVFNALPSESLVTTILSASLPIIYDLILGFIAGLIVIFILGLFKKLVPQK